MKPSTVIAIAALLLLQFGQFDLSGVQSRLQGIIPQVDVSPTPAIDAPSESLQRLVEPTKEKLASDRAKARRVSGVFRGFADAIEGPIGQRIETTGRFGEINSAAGRSVDLSGGPSIGSEVQAVVTEHVGIDRDPDDQSLWVDRQLSPSDRQRIAEAYRAIAWAGLQAAGG